VRGETGRDVLADGEAEMVSAEAGGGVETGKAMRGVCVEVGVEAGSGEAVVVLACVEAGGGEEAGMVMVAGREAVI
jgi:hypothetical protein